MLRDIFVTASMRRTGDASPRWFTSGPPAAHASLTSHPFFAPPIFPHRIRLHIGIPSEICPSWYIPPLTCLTSAVAKKLTTRRRLLQSIMEYNGGSIVAMAGKECVAIASDLRLGNQALTIATNFEKVGHLGFTLHALYLTSAGWQRTCRSSQSQTTCIWVCLGWLPTS